VTDAFWDERYRTAELIWSETPNQFLVSETADLTPGRALDVACGEGHNAIWLAEQGWTASGTDFSAVGLEKARALAGQRGVVVGFELHDSTTWTPPARSFDLVCVFYLQLPEPERSAALVNAMAGVAVGGTVLIVAHDVDNLAHGVGGPQSADVLYSVDEVADLVRSSGFDLVKAHQVFREVRTPSGETARAIDTLVRAVRQKEA